MVNTRLSTTSIATGADGCLLLAAMVIRDAFFAAIEGDESAELWIRESRRCKLFCDSLNRDHGQLIYSLESQQRERRKTKNRKRSTQRDQKLMIINRLRQIDKKAWEIIDAEIQKNASTQENGNASIIDANASIFSEGLLRQILSLTPDQQFELD